MRRQGIVLNVRASAVRSIALLQIVVATRTITALWQTVHCHNVVILLVESIPQKETVDYSKPKHRLLPRCCPPQQLCLH